MSDRSWYEGLAEIMGVPVEALLVWCWEQTCGLNHQRDMDMDIRAYLAQTAKETQDFFEHINDPENMQISGAAGNMWHKGLMKYGRAWSYREYTLREEIYGNPSG